MYIVIINIKIYIYNDEYSGYEVGFICTEWDDLKQRNTSKFCTVRTFTDETEAAEYVHWLNGGMSYKYDNVRTEN